MIFHKMSHRAHHNYLQQNHWFSKDPGRKSGWGMNLSPPTRQTGTFLTELTMPGGGIVHVKCFVIICNKERMLQ